jgi:hypothetical protein
MPQYLEIEIDGVSLAKMKTSHRDGTHYDICWCNNSGFQQKFSNFNTGVKCQPKDKIAQKKDFQNDFTHMCRAIAAASKTAKQFLNKLEKVEEPTPSELEKVKIHHRTNRYDRGIITIDPLECGKANLRIEVGAGPTRPKDAKPAQVQEFKRLGIDISGTSYPLSMTIHVLDSQGRWMLKLLSKGT